MCLYCGHPLALGKRLSGSRFCCQQHEELHAEEEGLRMVERVRAAANWRGVSDQAAEGETTVEEAIKSN